MEAHSLMGREFVLIYLPFCLQRLADGRYLPLNRLYKPVGMTKGWFDYEAQPEEARLRLTLVELDAVDFTGKASADGSAYLYEEGTSPSDSPEAWEAYLGRLSLLAGFAYQD